MTTPHQDSVDVISAATGIKRADMLAIWADVKANHAKLEACPRHEFGESDKKFGGHRTCSKCGGRLDSVTANWYERGLLHAQIK